MAEIELFQNGESKTISKICLLYIDYHLLLIIIIKSIFTTENTFHGGMIKKLLMIFLFIYDLNLSGCWKPGWSNASLLYLLTG